jgi:hypothetical protein
MKFDENISPTKISDEILTAYCFLKIGRKDCRTFGQPLTIFQIHYRKDCNYPRFACFRQSGFNVVWKIPSLSLSEFTFNTISFAAFFFLLYRSKEFRCCFAGEYPNGLPPFGISAKP